MTTKVTVETRAAQKYIQRTRNVLKKAYAERYYRWILSGRNGDSPDYAPLCYMAAQAVRMNLDEIYSGHNR